MDLELGTAVNSMLQASGFSGYMHSAISSKLAAFKFLRSFKKTGKTKSRKKSRIKRRSTAADVGSPSPSVLNDQSLTSNQEYLNESKGNTKYYKYPNTKRSYLLDISFVAYSITSFHLYCFRKNRWPGR